MGRGLHGAELGLAEHVAGFRRKRRGDDDEVGLAEEIVEFFAGEHLVDIGDRFLAATQTERAHVEGLGLERQVGAGVAEADDADGQPVEFAMGEVLPGVRPVVLDPAVGVAVEHQHQHHGVLGERDGAVPLAAGEDNGAFNKGRVELGVGPRLPAVDP